MTKEFENADGTVRVSFAQLHKTYETWPETASPNYSVDLTQMKRAAVEEALRNLDATLSLETWPETASPDYSVDLAQMKRAVVEEALRNLDATLSLAYEAATDSNKSFLRQRLNEAQYRLNAFTEALEDLAGIKRTR